MKDEVRDKAIPQNSKLKTQNSKLPIPQSPKKA
jgi:hypothetical protein